MWYNRPGELQYKDCVILNFKLFCFSVFLLNLEIPHFHILQPGVKRKKILDNKVPTAAMSDVFY